MRECPECRSAIEDGGRFCPHCGAASGAPGIGADPFVGRTVNGKFRIEALVGQGGMGRVYRAHHLTLDRPVVLKMLHQGYSGDPQIVQRFQREARAASRLNHPNSIAVLDFGAAEDGTLFMAMEYLGGRDLARIVQEEFPLAEARIVRIGAQILSALAEAHAQGIVHRDLKPENVMVEPRRDEPDFVKVLDFGIAKITIPGAGEPKLTQAGLVCGTPEYMSPEQARGADLDARSDLYSVGVILYQLATGDLPFSSDTPVGFLTKHLAEVPVPPRQRRPELGISPALDALVARALEKDPARRFQTAEEMRAELLACGRPAAAKATATAAPAVAVDAGPSTAEVTAAAVPRSRRPFWFFVGAMVLAVAGGGSIVLLTRRTAREREQEFRREGATANPNANPNPNPNANPNPNPNPNAYSVPESGGPSPSPSPSGPATTTPTTTTTPSTTSTSTSTTTPTTSSSAPAPHSRSHALALLKKADSARARQDTDAAIRLYLGALDADPGLAEAEKKVALCYQLKGDTRRAVQRYQRYLATDPPDAAKVRAILATLR